MRRKSIINILFSILIIWVGVTQVVAETTSTTTVEFPAVIHFLTPAGDDIEVGPGIYEVEATESWLKLVPEGLGRTEAVLLEATSGKHDETLTESEVRLKGEVEGEEENPDIFHLAMLQPDGTGLEAVGTASGIRPRGTQMVFLSRSNLKISSQVESLPRAKVSFPALKYYKPGFVSKRDSDFTDRCVPNVENQITKTLHNGKDQKDILAYRSGLKGAPSQENRGLHKAGRTGRDSWKHRQGIARYFSGTQIFFIFPAR